jgi:ankyrin repeat protein
MKKLSIYFGVIFLFTGCYNREKIVDKTKLLGNDYRLFQNTPVWELAKAVEDEDTLKISEAILKKNMDVNFQEPRFGSTLLMLSIRNRQYLNTMFLLNLNANPNVPDLYNGETALICAAKIDDVKFTELLLKHKANPNALEDASLKKNDEGGRQTALLAAINTHDSSSLKKVKLLIDAGADINYRDDYTNLPLSQALVLDRIDIALYLLQNGAKYDLMLYKTVDDQQVFILEALRKCIFDLNSYNYKKKRQVIAFLKNKGLDYSTEPIPDFILAEIKKKYPNDWKDYIKRY